MSETKSTTPGDQQNDDAAPALADKHITTITGSAHFWLSSPEREPEILISQPEASGPINDVVARIRQRFLAVLSSPPSIEALETLISKAHTDPTSFDEIVELFVQHRFLATPAHLSLLRPLNLSALSDVQQLNFRVCLIELYRRNEEYSVALEHVDEALRISRYLNKAESTLQNMIARGLCLAQLDDPSTEPYHREIVAFATSSGLQDGLAWAYRNWSTYLWERGRYADSLLLSEREAPLRKLEGCETYIRFLFFRARRLEIVHAKDAVEASREAEDILNSKTQELSDGTRAEAHYEIACIRFRQTDDYASIVKHARLAYELFNRWVGYEIRVAWCAGLIASAFEELGDISGAAQFRAERGRRFEHAGATREGLSMALAERLRAGDVGDDDLRAFEALVNGAQDLALEISWHTIIALRQLEKGQPEEGLSTCAYALTLVDAPKSRQLRAEEDLASLYCTMAECHLAREEHADYVRNMQVALSLAPSDLEARWRLCQNSFLMGMPRTALEQARILQARNVGVGPYRIAARCYLAEGMTESALESIATALQKYPTHPGLAGEYKELSDIKLGLLTPQESGSFRLPAGKDEGSVLTAQPASDASPTCLVEYRRLDSFKRSVLDIFVNYIYGIQKTSPRFLTHYKSGKVGLEEGDFRDDSERICSLKWQDVGGETRHGHGRTDLLIRAPNTLGAAIAEFKIWGRNDYKDVAGQLLGYLTDFDSMGIVFMVNPNKSEITSKYIEAVIFSQLSYVSGSFRRRPIGICRLDHYYSRHRSQMNKEVEVFHFVFNLWEGSPSE